jgi:hypothetical protein
VTDYQIALAFTLAFIWIGPFVAMAVEGLVYLLAAQLNKYLDDE